MYEVNIMSVSVCMGVIVDPLKLQLLYTRPYLVQSDAIMICKLYNYCFGNTIRDHSNGSSFKIYVLL